MFKKQWRLTAILVIAAALAGGIVSNGISLLTQVQAQRNQATLTAPVRKWEYQAYVAADPRDLADQANKLGNDGWEMTNVVTDQRLVVRFVGYFRRPKQ